MTVELTKTDKANGWTKESLEKYHEEREKAAGEKVFRERKTRPSSQASYNPHKWRE